MQFSDGSKVKVLLIPNDGSARVVSFLAKRVEWVRFEPEDSQAVPWGSASDQGNGLSGVSIAAVRTNYPVAGKARIYLTKVASTTASTSVGWFVAEY